jgi:protease-4
MSAAAIYPRLFAKLFASPLMLHGPTRATFESELLTQISGQRSGVIQPQAVKDDEKEYRQQRVFQRVGNVAVISIEGVIDKRVSMMDLNCYGGVDLADIDEALNQAADPSISKVLLYINSPGGSVTGTPETAARIAALAKTKYVEAFVDVMACSAGYYLAAQATKITAAPSSVIGSIGVYIAVLDASRAMEIAGYKMQMISAGKYKGIGASWKPLTEEETEMLQAQVDSMYADFKAAVTSKRPKVADSTMQGQWFDGVSADDLYLVDELSNDTLDERVSRLLV